MENCQIFIENIGVLITGNRRFNHRKSPFYFEKTPFYFHETAFYFRNCIKSAIFTEPVSFDCFNRL